VPNTHIKIQLGAPALQRRLRCILRVALRAHSDNHEGSDKDDAKLTIWWKSFTILKLKRNTENEHDAICSASYNPTQDGYVTCDITVFQAFSSILNATDKEGKRYWDAAWDNVIRVHRHHLDEAEKSASKDATDGDDIMSTGASAKESPTKKPRRHDADAFAKDNSAFPLFIVWKVAEGIDYDQACYSKKSGKNKSNYPQSASAATSSWQTPVRAAPGNWDTDPRAGYSKTANTQNDSTHTIMACRPSSTLHWKVPFNKLDTGGLRAQVDNATIEQVATALGINPSEYPRMTSVEQADWVMIIEQVLKNADKGAISTHVMLDNKTIIKSCQDSCYTAKAIKEGRHQTMGAWMMDFLWAEFQVRTKRSDPLVSFLAVPSGHFSLLWTQIYSKPEDEAWDTKATNSNAEQVGHILETWATFLLLAKDTTSIRLPLNSLIHIDGKLEHLSFASHGPSMDSIRPTWYGASSMPGIRPLHGDSGRMNHRNH
jgi:hypothetical protein